MRVAEKLDEDSTVKRIFNREHVTYQLLYSLTNFSKMVKLFRVPKSKNSEN